MFYGGGALEGDLTSRGVTVRSLQKRGRWDLLAFSYRLIRELGREQPDVVHGYLGSANIFAFLTKLVVRGSRIVWGVRASDMNLDQYDWLARTVYRAECRLSRFADLIICNSFTGRDTRIACGYPAARTVVVSNGIDSERFAPDASARKALRREWEISEREFLVGLVGRFDPKKDHATFLRAAARVHEDLEHVRFICIGGDPKNRRFRFEQLGSALGLDDHLIWSQARPDMPLVYNALDLVVSSSSWGEGFPNVVGEAMATGIACVVTDVGDSARVVGDAGWVCPPGDPVALADAILLALSNKDKLTDQGPRVRERITSEFSVDRLVKSTSAHLTTLLDPSPPR